MTSAATPAPTAAPTEAAIGAAIGVAGTTNLRSTAGYPATGGRIREGALFRSDALHAIGAPGISKLREFGVSRVLDLRDHIELGLEPSAVVGSEIEVIHQPIFGDGGLASIGSFGIDDVYRFVIEQRADALAETMRLIALAPEGGVLVHCTAGKDRTGLVIATALAAVGVPPEVIIADYAATESNLAGPRAASILAVAEARFGALDEDAIELMVGSPKSAIVRTLDLIESHYGGIERMLLDSGLDLDTLAILRARLVG